MTLRWGIVTAGKISNDFVNALNSYKKKGDQAIVVIAARTKNRPTEFAKTHNIEKVSDSYEELATSNNVDVVYIPYVDYICDCDVRKIEGLRLKANKYHVNGFIVTDVVYIAALNPDHYTLTKLFLENGKHVLCEKPLCLNYKQSQSLMNLAKKKNLFLMEAMWTRFSPAYIDLEKDIKDGKLGDVKFVEANFGFYAEVDRLRKKELGGGALLDIGIYLLHLAQYVFKEEPTKVIAVGNLLDTGVDESETIILEYSGGRRAVLNANTKLQLSNKATVYGTKGRITLEEPFHFPHKVTGVDGTVKEYVLHTSKLPYNYTNSAGLVYEAIEVARCIKTGLLESPRMPHKDSLMLAKLMDTIRKQLGVHYDADDEEYAA